MMDDEGFSEEIVKDLLKEARTGGVPLASMGSEKGKVFWDSLFLDACQVTNPSIDPLREPIELSTYLGAKPDGLCVEKNRDGSFNVKTELPPQIKLEMPVIISGMSFGAISLNAHKAIAMAVNDLGILMNTGEGGLHPALYSYKDSIIVQVASGRFGVDTEYLNRAAAIEIKIGQGAKPGIGGHLPGEKVTSEISSTRAIPEGTDAISPAPHHDIYSIEDLHQLIFAIKEATNYKKPVGVKIAAVHNVAPISAGIVRAGADFLTIDGFRGSTGAAPKIIRDNFGIPIELAIAVVDDRLRQESLRHRITLIATGGIRNSADAIKAIALGADIVAIGRAALIALGCTQCRQCHTNRCPVGIATQDQRLVAKLEPEKGRKSLVNLLTAWGCELKEALGALGLNAIESLCGNRERLRAIGLNERELKILGVKYAGE